MEFPLRAQRLMQMRSVVRVAATGVLVAAMASLAGCSGNGRAPGSPDPAEASGALMPKATGYPMASPAAPNADDLRFAQDLLSHRRQAIAMLEAAGNELTEDQVRLLADGMRLTYLADSRKLTNLLQGWGVQLGESGSPAASQSTPIKRGETFDQAFLAALIRDTQESVGIAERRKALPTTSSHLHQIATDTASSGTALLVMIQRIAEELGT